MTSSCKEVNYYEILNAQSTATFDELKRNYKQLILQCHPDKLQQQQEQRQDQQQHDCNQTAATVTIETASENTCNQIAADINNCGNDDNIDPNVATSFGTSDVSKFVLINEAWNTLKDPAKRKLYDAQLLLDKFQMHSNIYARLRLADMEQCHIAATTTNDDDDCNDQKVSNTSHAIYTYNCRCGGQYIVDESADDELFKGDNDDGDDDGEVMVECSECSLVILLLLKPQIQKK